MLDYLFTEICIQFWGAGVLLSFYLLKKENIRRSFAESRYSEEAFEKQYNLNEEEVTQLWDGTCNVLEDFLIKNDLADKYFSEQADSKDDFFVGNKSKYFTKGYLYYWLLLVLIFGVTYLLTYLFTNFIFSAGYFIDGITSDYVIELPTIGVGFHVFASMATLLSSVGIVSFVILKIAPYLYKNNFINSILS